MSTKNEIKVAAAKARSAKLSPEKRREIARKAALVRHNKDAVQATHESHIILGDLQIECAVLEDEVRVINERAMTKAFGGKRGGSHWKRLKEGGANLPVYLSAKNYFPFIPNDLAEALSSPIKYRTKSGNIAHGIDAKLLPEICNVFLRARDEDELHIRQIPLAAQADIIMRGLATLGIVALIDEATGFQRERAVDALARILEEFIAKELQPWVRTFPPEFYEGLYRLRGLDFPKDKIGKPAYFGHLTNDIVYKRLAPGVLAELKKKVPKGKTGRHTTQLHRGLTRRTGHPKLLAHMDSVLTLMSITDDGDYEGFIKLLDKAKPRYDKTIDMDFD